MAIETAKMVPQGRDTRIDVFRALALLTIFINHVPGTIYEHFTHKIWASPIPRKPSC